MKRYVGGLGASAFELLAYLTSRECRLFGATDDLVKLHGLWVLVSLETRAHELLRPLRLQADVGADVRRFDVKDKRFGAFQLESLILAQNERWRQA